MEEKEIEKNIIEVDTKDVKGERTIWQTLVRGVYFTLVGALLLFILVIVFLSSSSIEPYQANYELKIVDGEKSMKYSCDTFIIEGNQYRLYDTNKVETNMIVIPTNLIVDIKNMKKDLK